MARQAGRFPPVLQAASLKRAGRHRDVDGRPGFPPVLQAASLKLQVVSAAAGRVGGFPPVLQAASLKLGVGFPPLGSRVVFSACFAGGLIEASGRRTWAAREDRCFPPVLQAASLKRRLVRRRPDGPGGFPPVLQAASLKRRRDGASPGGRGRFSACLQATSLKPGLTAQAAPGGRVFRLFCRRPH